MTLRLPAVPNAPASQYFALDLHASLGSDERHNSTAFALKTGRLVTISFLLYAFEDRTAFIAVEPLIYIPAPLAPVGLDTVGDAENLGAFSPWFICEANSVLGGDYPRNWALRLQAYYGDNPGMDNGIYEQHAFGPFFTPAGPGVEERVEIHGAFTYVSET